MWKGKGLLAPVTAIFLILQAAVMAALAVRERTDYVWSVAVTTGFWLAYTFLEVKFRLQMSAYVRILMTATIFFDAFFGYCLYMYENSFVFDKLLHIFGGYSFALFAYALVTQMQAAQLVRPVKFILALCLGMSLGVFYEIFEFVGDIVSHPTPPSQPGLLDTDLDLIGDTVGALAAALHVSMAKISRFVVKEKDPI